MGGVERRSLRARMASSIASGGVRHIPTAGPSSPRGINACTEGEEGETPAPAMPWKRSRGDATRQYARAVGQPSSPKTHIGTDIKADGAPLTAELSSPAGDLAIKTRSWQSLDPNPVPDVRLFLPSNDHGRSSLAAYSFYLRPAVVVLSAVACFAAWEVTLAFRQDHMASAGRPTDIVLTSASQSGLMHGADKPKAARLVIEVGHAPVNEPLPLGITLRSATGDEAIILTDLAQGTRLLIGEPLGATAWRVPARGLGRLLIYPPVSFAGVMAATVELRAPDDTLLDIRVAKLEWLPNPGTIATVSAARGDQGDVARPNQTSVMPPDRQAQLFKRGGDFLKDGNVAAARLMLQSVADAGNAQAALLLGTTYDPLMLADLGVRGLQPDPVAARAWYRRALGYGSSEASSRIERLAQTDK